MRKPEEKRRPVTIEELLHLKRAERPDPSYWVQFESEMRQKQLAALLRKDPWWTRLVQSLGRRHYFQLGASAALVTLVLLNIREQNQTVSVPGAELPRAMRQVEMASLPVPVAEVPNHDRELSDSRTIDEILATTEVAAVQPQEAHAARQPSASEVLEKAVSQIHRSLAAEIAEIGQVEAGINPVDLMNRGRLASSVRTEAVRQLPELGSVSLAANRKSVRLLAGYDDRKFVPEPNAPEIVRERLARRLGDQDLADQVRRLDVKGDRLSLRL